MTKQELLKNPLVKEIAYNFARQIESNYDAGKGEDWDEFVKEQTAQWDVISHRSKINGKITTGLIWDGSWEIYSVRRKHDCEIFTINDIVNTDTTKNTRIETLQFGENGQVYFNDNRLLYGYKKAKPFVFITQDDKYIFEGDSYFSVSDDYQILRTDIARKDCLYESANRAFSTIHAAEEWILLNKPCLSVNNVKTILYAHIGNKLTISMEDLNQLAKSKL